MKDPKPSRLITFPGDLDIVDLVNVIDGVEEVVRHQELLVDFVRPPARGNNLKSFEDLYLKARAIIWPGLSHVCRIRSTAEGVYLVQPPAESAVCHLCILVYLVIYDSG